MKKSTTSPAESPADRASDLSGHQGAGDGASTGVTRRNMLAFAAAAATTVTMPATVQPTKGDSTMPDTIAALEPTTGSDRPDAALVDLYRAVVAAENDYVAATEAADLALFAARDAVALPLRAPGYRDALAAAQAVAGVPESRRRERVARDRSSELFARMLDATASTMVGVLFKLAIAARDESIWEHLVGAPGETCEDAMLASAVIDMVRIVRGQGGPMPDLGSLFDGELHREIVARLLDGDRRGARAVWARRNAVSERKSGAGNTSAGIGSA